MKLTAKLIEKLNTPGRYKDDAAPGLYVFVQAHRTKAGEVLIRKSWVQRLTVHGRRVDLGLGTIRWGATTISEARRRALANYRIARDGGDPRRPVAGPEVLTFADGIEAVLALQRPNWRDGGKSEKQWRASLRDYAGPLMDQPVDQIDAGAVLTVISPIWNAKRETARRVLQRVGAVLRWAVAGGYRDSTPIEAVRAALPKNGHKTKHHRALPHAEVSGALTTIRESRAGAATKGALEFLILTGARSGEVRGMTFSEVDLDAAVWTIPADRIKAGRAHRVPLSKAALAVLRAAHEATGGEGLVFPSPRGRMLSDATLGKLMRDRGIDAVPHGFRSSFKDWASESGIAREVSEAALAHVVRDKAEAAYARSDLVARRAEVMAEWAAYIGA